MRKLELVRERQKKAVDPGKWPSLSFLPHNKRAWPCRASAVGVLLPKTRRGAYDLRPAGASHQIHTPDATAIPFFCRSMAA